jgi:formate-dependent nitrite reductase membrane component NrfD
MSTTTGIILALALGSVALFSVLFVVILFSLRNRWEHLGEPEQPSDQSDGNA